MLLLITFPAFLEHFSEVDPGSQAHIRSSPLLTIVIEQFPS